MMTQLYLIPRNVTQRFEFFPGFGWIELALTLAGLAVGALLFLVLGLFTDHLARLLVVGFTTAAGFFASKGSPRSGKTILSLIKDAKIWKTAQRRYLYFFGTGSE